MRFLNPKRSLHMTGRANSSSAEHTLFTRTHLCSFFARYPDFKYDPSKPFMDEFWRLVETYQFDRRGRRFKAARKGVKDAKVLQFKNIYGTHSDDGVYAWYNFFRAIGIKETPRDIGLCHKKATSIHLNICDLIDLPVTRIGVKTFPNESELSRYSLKNVNRPMIVPLISKKLDPILGDLFRRIGNPLKPKVKKPASAPKGAVKTVKGNLLIRQSRPPKKMPETGEPLRKRPKKTGTTLSDSLQNIETPHTSVHHNEQAQADVIQSINMYNTSTLAKPSEYAQLQATTVEIFNSYLEIDDGPPIGLFHPAFNSFQRRIGSKLFAPTQWQLSSTLPLLTTSQKLYGKQNRSKGRMEAFKPLLTQLLDIYVGNSDTPGVTPDGVIQGSNGTYPMILEIENKFDTDPSVETAVALADYWRDNRFDWVRRLCCCPSMILAIKGPWMCVMGGIMLGYRPVVQPLTPFFLVGNNPSSPEHANIVSKIFASLAKSLSELDHFDRGLQRFRGTRNFAGHFPYIQQLIINRKRVDIEYQGFSMPWKPVFQAVARSEDGDAYPITVKFAKSYNAAAHRLLAAMNLAPELLFISSEDPSEFKVANRTMVVMKEAPHRNLSGTSPPPDCVLRDVKRALDVLHKHNIVFGDLRPPNVLAVKDKNTYQTTGGMLVDFDWCGTAGQATYPVDINMNMEWPEGVGPGLPMQLEHDKVMLKRLSGPAAFERRISYDTYIRSLHKPMAECDNYHFG
ncbi:hypothetical protein RSOLAG22IIIB_12774 [Rhizoctonia solani]|uniref:Protein kinase domain-containing protein n=1 Tax=Rhizoctonia solani TaxID=456999 RepID=A0A0K6GH58_9AGAM|nr:hypothetical protein RSOLAG22IIIB_12774 [Rhizoctonia solani]